MCPECYSDYKRITPLLKPKNCLNNHRQYICSKCGRNICASVDEKGKFRAMFPFKSFEIAMLYLRSAEVINEKLCGIYEIEDKKGRKSFKIFSSKSDLDLFLKKNKEKKCNSLKPIFKTDQYKNYSDDQLRKISSREADIYLFERKKESKIWGNFGYSMNGENKK
jgi:hypothetical protein